MTDLPAFTRTAAALVAANDRVPEQREACDGLWIFGDVAAAHLIAATSWPFERRENREAWAPRMITDRALLEREYEQARERLESAYVALLVGSEQRRPVGRVW